MKRKVMSERAAIPARRALSAAMTALRKARGLSQEALGKKAGLSGKFIGEVQRMEKSISIDSLYKVAVALDVPLSQLTDVPPGRRSRVVVPSEEAEKIYALVSDRKHPAAEVRRAYEMLRVMLKAA